MFLTLAILSIVLGEQGWLSLAGAGLYLAVARRMWCVTCAALAPGVRLLSGRADRIAVMAIPLVPHIWS